MDKHLLMVPLNHMFRMRLLLSMFKYNVTVKCESISDIFFNSNFSLDAISGSLFKFDNNPCRFTNVLFKTRLIREVCTRKQQVYIYQIILKNERNIISNF